MRSRTKYLLSAGVALLCLAGGVLLGLPKWRDYVARQQDERLYQAAAGKLRAGQPRETLAIVSRRVPLPAESADNTRRWASLEVEANTRLSAVPRLAALYRWSPEAVAANEAASLVLARAFMHSRDDSGFKALTGRWQAGSTNPASWFTLGVDRLLLEGKTKEARQKLLATNFAGAADIPRLTRLAVLTASTNLTAAWNYLADANALDSRSPDVRLFRGQILERIGRLPLARVEYVAAHLTEPASPWLADQLAEFYRRSGNPAAAVEVWSDNLKQSPTDYTAFKAAFWSRVVAAPTNYVAPKIAAGNLAPLVTYLGQLPAGQFWSSNAFAQVAGATTYLRERQELYWLQLIEHLRSRQYGPALALLRTSRFRGNSYAPELERALARLLALRELKTLSPVDLPPLPAGYAGTDHHSFFAELDAAANRAPAPERMAFLRSNDALAHAFLAAGWLETGLALAPEPPAAGTPADAVYARAQALRFTRGPVVALAFLQDRMSTPELKVLAAELQFSRGAVAEAEALLLSLASQPGDAGQRAAWLLATRRLEQRQTAEATQVIQANPEFAASIAGRELLARVALVEGSVPRAQAIYRQLAKDSVEARTFLAREAFTQKDWPTARRYTEELLALMPDQIELRANLAAIAKAETATPR